MVEDRNRYQSEVPEQKKKTGAFWKGFGLVCLSLFLATLTVFIISM